YGTTLCLLLLGLLATSSLQGQVNIFGKPGVITTPSAEWKEEKPLGLSFAYLPKEYSHQVMVSRTSSEGGDAFHFYNARIHLTSFIDIGLTIGYRPSLSDVAGIGERHMDIRFR